MPRVESNQDENAMLRWKWGVMWNERIYSLTTNHNPAPLPKQKRMRALGVGEMESSSNIDLRDVSWWMSIKNAYRPRVLVILKLSKKRCIPLATWKKPFCITCKHDWNNCGPPSTWKTYSSKMGLSEIKKPNAQIRSH
jgi:hypothetical protein